MILSDLYPRSDSAKVVSPSVFTCKLITIVWEGEVLLRLMFLLGMQAAGIFVEVAVAQQLA